MEIVGRWESVLRLRVSRGRYMVVEVRSKGNENLVRRARH